MDPEKKHIMIHFERGGSFKATLDFKSAPDTCRLVWEILPIENEIIHSRWSGREVISKSNAVSSPRKKIKRYTQVLGKLSIGVDVTREVTNNRRRYWQFIMVRSHRAVLEGKKR